MIRRALLPLLLCRVMFPGAAVASPEAWVTVTKGMVLVARAGTGDWLKVALPHALYAGDRVMTHAGSQALIQFDDGHEIHLSRKTTLEIKALEEDAGTGARRIVTHLWRGMIQAVVNHLAPADDFRVESNVAIAAVKGTKFILTPRQVTVLPSPTGRPSVVSYSSRTGGAPISVTQNTTSSVGRGGAPSPPVRVSPALLAATLRQFALQPVATPRTSTRATAQLPAPRPPPPAPPALRALQARQAQLATLARAAATAAARQPPPPPAPPRATQLGANQAATRAGPSPLPTSSPTLPPCP